MSFPDDAGLGIECEFSNNISVNDQIECLLQHKIPSINVDFPLVNACYKFYPSVVYFSDTNNRSIYGIIDVTFSSYTEQETATQSSGFHFQERKVFAENIENKQTVEILKGAIEWLENKRNEYVLRINRKHS